MTLIERLRAASQRPDEALATLLAEAADALERRAMARDDKCDYTDGVAVLERLGFIPHPAPGRSTPASVYAPTIQDRRSHRDSETPPTARNANV